MNLKKLVRAGTLLAILGTSLYAGTPGITGIHSGTYDLKAYRFGINYATTVSSYNWVIDFTNNGEGTVKLTDGQVHAILGFNVDYKLLGDKTITDNNDGTYTLRYKFQPQGFFSSPIFTFETVLDITETPTGLSITSVDSDNNGTPGAKSISTTGSFPIELNWFGSTN